MNKKIIIGVGVVLVIGLGFLGYKMYKKKQEQNELDKK